MSADATENAQNRIRGLFAERPQLRAVRDRLAGRGGHLVGGAVRDLLLGIEPSELDIAIEGDAVELARELDPEAVVHQRFGTASLVLSGVPVDLARTRTETYSRSGALPDVTPATIAEDLARRDFSVNAMAVSLEAELLLRDPFEGAGELASRTLRALHGRSLADDPTRALRAARYSARLGFAIEPLTLEQIRNAPIDTVSSTRIGNELGRTAVEDDPSRAFALLEEWGLAWRDGDSGLVAELVHLCGEDGWAHVDRADAVLAAAQIHCGAYQPNPRPLERARRLAATEASTPAQAFSAAAEASDEELVLAQALGAAWVDRYVQEWRRVEVEIAGSDLIAAGVPPGPAVGSGLEAALEAKLAGIADTREAQLRIALAAARG
jgi:tRNA nucleotidyltransferase (CCA-adding enzyme)